MYSCISKMKYRVFSELHKCQIPKHHHFPDGHPPFSSLAVLLVIGKESGDKLENVGVASQKASSVEFLLPLEKVWLFKDKKKQKVLDLEQSRLKFRILYLLAM